MQGKGKEKVILQEIRDFRSDRYINGRPRRDFVGQSETTNAQNVRGLYFENWCIRCWKKSRANHTSDGRIRWQESQQSETSTFIAKTTKTTDTPWRIAGTFGITWTSWSKKES